MRLMAAALLIVARTSLAPFDAASQALPAVARWRPVATWTVGGDPATSFGRIVAAVVDRNGTAFVLDADPPSVSVISVKGRQLRTFGRKGDGPGEFRSPSRIGLQGDTIWVTDPGPRRLTFFDRTGRVLGSMSTAGTRAVGTGFLGVTPAGPLADGGVAASATALMSAIVGGEIDLPIVRVSPRGDLTNVLALIPTRRSMVRLPGVGAGGQRGRLYTAEPFADAPLWQPARDGSGIIILQRVAATRNEPSFATVWKAGPVGDTVFRRRLPYQPEPVDEQQVAQHIRESLEPTLAGRSRPIRFDEDEVRKLIYVPRFFPPFSKLAVASDGTIWLRQDRPGRDPVRHLVLTSDGRPLAEVALPRSARVLDANAGAVWVGAITDDGVPVIRRFTLAR